MYHDNKVYKKRKKLFEITLFFLNAISMQAKSMQAKLTINGKIKLENR